jgi:phosphatidylglycerophosphate synthase
MTKTIPRSEAARATLIESETIGGVVEVFGLDARERLRRSFENGGLALVDADAVAALGDVRIVALSTAHFYDERLISALARHEQDIVLLSVAAGEQAPVAVGVAGAASRIAPLIDAIRRDEDPGRVARAAGIAVVFPDELVPDYDQKLRKSAPPFVIAADPARAREIEARIFDAAYKNITDFVTKFVWPVPARIVTGWCARIGVSPNSLTLLSYALALAAGIAFWEGRYALGLASAWVMTFLDTVDGKLARVTLTTSRLGDVLDHGLDLVHPPLWWAAWGAGLASAHAVFGPYEVWVVVVVGGYLVGRLLEGAFIVLFGQEMFTWRPFDLAFRLVIARRNPNLVILSLATILGEPAAGLITVGVWTLCCIGIQCVRIAQAGADRLRGREISPYLG